MKTSQNLSFFINQLRLSTRHAHISTPLRTPLRTQLFSQNAQTSRTLHTHFSKLKPITPLSRTQQNLLRPPYTPKVLHRPSSSNADPPGTSFTPKNDTLSTPSPSEASPTSTETTPTKPPRKEYQLIFTCKPCGYRSPHRISRHGYHFGTVLITCPECKNRHVISDHLKIFSELSMTIEDLMRDKGELVKRGSINEDGEIEFWDQASETVRRTPKDARALLLEKMQVYNEEMDYPEWKRKEVLFEERGVHPKKEPAQEEFKDKEEGTS